ncbi:MAG: TldD/PmbA family protein [Actinomycetota bacterium]|nr:TldD/PmbA family protein [Actinomycetota bacterium]
MSQAPASPQLIDLALSVIERARPGEQVEACAVRSTKTEVDALRGEVDALTSAETRGVGVRVIVEGRQGYASTAVVTEGGLDEALAEARSNARVATPDEANELPRPEEPPVIGDLVHPAFLSTPVEDKIALALELEAVALRADSRVRGVRLSKYGDAFQEVALASTKGLGLTAARTEAWAYVRPLASEGDETQTGLGITVGRAPTGLDVEAAGREGAERALRLLGASKPESRRVPVVFDPHATASFLGVLASALSAEAALKGRSLFAERLGEEVAADVTLLDDGLLPDGLATAPWDGEGVPQQKTCVIEAGVLSSLLHNTWTARRFGGEMTSTGNASRPSFRASPGVAPTNLYFAPGSLDAAGLLNQAGEAFYVQDVAGLHSGANPVSGDFSVGVTGLAVRGGELAEPFREATVASTLLEVLRSIVAVGSDLRFYPFGGALGGSTLLVSGMSVSGR